MQIRWTRSIKLEPAFLAENEEALLQLDMLDLSGVAISIIMVKEESVFGEVAIIEQHTVTTNMAG